MFFLYFLFFTCVTFQSNTNNYPVINVWYHFTEKSMLNDIVNDFCFSFKENHDFIIDDGNKIIYTSKWIYSNDHFELDNGANIYLATTDGEYWLTGIEYNSISEHINTEICPYIDSSRETYTIEEWL